MPAIEAVETFGPAFSLQPAVAWGGGHGQGGDDHAAAGELGALVHQAVKIKEGKNVSRSA
jgi:hypothetical protein